MKIKMVIVYARRSTKKGQKYSLETQLQGIKKFCKKHKIIIFKVFRETYTGKTTKRPEFEKALILSRKKKIPIIVESIDRIGRDASQVIGLLNELRFISVEDGLNAKLFKLHKKAIFAQEEREKISERTKKGLATAKRSGVQLGNPNIEQAQEKAVQSIKQQADDFAQSFMPILEVMETKSYRSAAIMLNQMGVKSRRGGEWTGQTIKNLIERLRKLKNEENKR